MSASQRTALWILAAAIWTSVIIELFSLRTLSRFGVGDLLPLAPLSWPLMLALAGVALAFAVALACTRLFKAPSLAWVGSALASATILGPQAVYSLWLWQMSQRTLGLLDLTGSLTDPLATIVALIGYPSATWLGSKTAAIAHSKTPGQRA